MFTFAASQDDFAKSFESQPDVMAYMKNQYCKPPEGEIVTDAEFFAARSDPMHTSLTSDASIGLSPQFPESVLKALAVITDRITELQAAVNSQGLRRPPPLRGCLSSPTLGGTSAVDVNSKVSM